MSVAKVLRDHARPEWRWSHIPSGEIRDKRTAGKLKQMGVKAGWPDFVLIAPDSRFHAIELKRAGERLSESQDEFRLWCVRHGIPHVVAFSLDDVLTSFEVWDCLTIRIVKQRVDQPLSSKGGRE
ncbi:VRR-NUC domain-containing protein [Methylocapsa palsarum]|nr:VRR-NUC domain-containing protein [Methylocapsa palsarum]